MVRWQRWAPAAPFGGLVVLYVLYRQVYDLVGIGGVELAVPKEAWRGLVGPQAAVADVAARLTWGITVLVFGLAFVVALVICLRVIGTATAGKVRMALLAGALAGTATGIVLGMDNPLTLPQLVYVLEAGFVQMEVKDGLFLLYFLNGMAIAAALFSTFAVAATLVDASFGENGIGRLKEQARRLRHVLYCGAAVLIAGTAQATAMHRLPIAYLQEPWSEALESVAQLAAVATGALWSLFLVAIYLPAALVLRARFAAEAQRVLPEAGEKERESWLATHGLDLSLSQQLKRLAALLGPLLSSLPLTGLFQLLG